LFILNLPTNSKGGGDARCEWVASE